MAKLGSREKLTSSEVHTLETRVLPTARRWVKEYPKGSQLYEAAADTLAYWGERP